MVYALGNAQAAPVALFLIFALHLPLSTPISYNISIGMSLIVDYPKRFQRPKADLRRGPNHRHCIPTSTKYLVSLINFI